MLTILLYPLNKATGQAFASIPSWLGSIVIGILMNYYRFSYNIPRSKFIGIKTHMGISAVGEQDW